MGISQEQLALRAGLDRTYVGGVERGERNVALLNIVKLANSLNTTAADLLRGVDSQECPPSSNRSSRSS
jgi:transcriptional regulator with XRE-family HTH domain